MIKFRHALEYASLRVHTDVMHSWIDGYGEPGVVLVRPHPRSVDPDFCHLSAACSKWVLRANILDEIDKRLSWLRVLNRMLRFVQNHIKVDIFGAAGRIYDGSRSLGECGRCQKQSKEMNFHNLSSENAALFAKSL